jgi:tetratricopeptide (TPR) repeat protein
MVELFILENDFSRAEMVLREALAHREMPEYLYNLSWLLLVQKRSIPEAIALLKKARLKKAPYHEALFNQSVAESLNDQYEDSLQHMQNYTKYTTPHDVASLVKNYRTLARVNINNVLASMNIATYLFNEGYEQEAIAELMYLLKRKPDFVPGMKLLADYEYQTGQIEMAIESCHRVLKAAEEEKTLETYLLLAKIYGSKGDYDSAMEFVEHALQINPNLPELNYQYATFMAQKGDFQVALKHYKQIAASNPSFPRIQSRIRMVEEELRESHS